MEIEGGEHTLLTIFNKVWANLSRLVTDEAESFLRDQDGQGLTEYALILALIALIAIAALTLLGGQVTDFLSTAANSV